MVSCSQEVAPNQNEYIKKYYYMPKISPGGLPVSSINSVHTLPSQKYLYTSKTCSTWVWLDM